MADISKIQTKNIIYNIKDETARQENINLSNKIKLLDNLYLGCFFDQNDLNKLVFKISLDTKNWQTLSKLNINGRDPSILYKDGYFYIAVTNYTPTRDLIIYKSNDLINFETNNINMGLLNWDSKWAPEFYVEDDKVYLLISAKETSESKFKILISEIDLNTFECSNLSDITPDNTLNLIDPQIVKINDYYYLTVSDQSTSGESYIKIYRSTTIGGWNLYNSNVFKTCNHVEGSFILPVGNKYVIYGDPAYIPGLLMLETKDLSISDSEGEPTDYIISVDGSFDIKHGSILYCNNNEVKNVVYNLIENNNININYKTSPIKISHIIDITNENVNNEWIADNTIIFVGGNGNSTIEKLFNPFRAKEFKICFFASESASLTINKIVDLQGTTRTINRTYQNSANLNEKVFTQITNSTSPISNDYTE